MPPSARSVGLLLALGLAGCPPREPTLPEAIDPSPADAGAEAGPVAGPDALGWQTRTASPEPSRATGLARELTLACGRADASLDRVAERLLARETSGAGPADPTELAFELRVQGSPHVWPRSWSYAGPSLDPADARGRAERWLASFRDGGTRVCGAAHARSADREGVVLVAVDALADLEAVPTRARPGQWLDVTAHLLVPAREAKVVVLGPRGAPHAIPTTLDSGVVRARFAPTSAGSFLLQVLADVDKGPRPVLEAYVFADQSPPARHADSPAPGEDAGQGQTDAADALFAMLNAARRAEGARSLARNANLDRAARVHAEAMREKQTLGHDVGKGSVKERLEALGLSPVAFGENVARATTTARAHRAIWASPSHRGNLLEPRYDHVGVAAVSGPEGVWVTEVFAQMR